MVNTMLNVTYEKLNVGLGKGNAVKGKVTQTIYVSTLEKW